jgi:DNA-binding NtrC family response regulator
MLRKKRILVVDDDERVLFVLHDTLIRLGSGYEIVTAQSGYEALDKAREVPFDLIITDLRMPGMDGVELTEAVRTLSPGTVVIWITAYGSQETNAEAQRLGVYRCLDKPLEVTEIRQIAREALEAAGRQTPDVIDRVWPQ